MSAQNRKQVLNSSCCTLPPSNNKQVTELIYIKRATNLCKLKFLTFKSDLPSLPLCASSEEQMPGALLGRKDFWRKMFKSQSAASDTSSQSEQDTSECTTAHSGTTTDRRSRSRSRRISLRKKLKLPIGKSWYQATSLLIVKVEGLLYRGGLGQDCNQKHYFILGGPYLGLGTKCQ